MKNLLIIMLLLISGVFVSYNMAEKSKSSSNNKTIFRIEPKKEQSFIDIANKHDVIGMGLAVLTKNKVPKMFFYGKRNLSLDLSANKKTLFKVASISKVVTAIAVMKLVENGQIDLDKDISFYLKKSVQHGFYEDIPITIRMLLSHTSGIYDGNDYEFFLEETYSEREVPAIYLILEPNSSIWLKKKPGTYFTYSNLNYGILATIIECVTNTRFDDYVLANILNPLNIDGGFNIQKIQSKENISVLYRGAVAQVDDFKGNYPRYKEFPLGINGVYFAPQSGLRISVDDLSKILQLLINKGEYNGIRIIKESSIDEMEKKQWLFNEKNGDTYEGLFLSWGLGLQHTLNNPKEDFIMPGITFKGHHGDAYGLIADMYYNREKGLAFVFVSNGTLNTTGYLSGTKSEFFKLEEDIFDLVFDTYNDDRK